MSVSCTFIYILNAISIKITTQVIFKAFLNYCFSGDINKEQEVSVIFCKKKLKWGSGDIIITLLALL